VTSCGSWSQLEPTLHGSSVAQVDPKVHKGSKRGSAAHLGVKVKQSPVACLVPRVQREPRATEDHLGVSQSPVAQRDTKVSQSPVACRVLKGHQDSAANQVSVVHQDLKVHQDPAANWSPMACQDLKVYQDSVANQDHQDPVANQVPVSHQDSLANQDPAANQGHQNSLANQGHQDPAANQGHQNSLANQDHQDPTANQGHQNSLANQDHHDPAANQGHQNSLANQDHQDPAANWSPVACQDLKVYQDSVANQDHQDPAASQVLVSHQDSLANQDHHDPAANRSPVSLRAPKPPPGCAFSPPLRPHRVPPTSHLGLATSPPCPLRVPSPAHLSLVLLALSNLLLLPPPSRGAALEFSGSPGQWARYRRWSPATGDRLSFSFKTNVSRALLLYLDDGGNCDFLELLVTEGRLRLRFAIACAEPAAVQPATAVSDGRWHEVLLTRKAREAALAVDGE
ncbi:NRX2A protein, partial [Urocolius indicus]|nr:NRX2A protein [Urocolius indicus]